MPNKEYVISAFINAIRQNVDDIEQYNIDQEIGLESGDIGFRASKSYWIDYGWDRERWADHDLPQISVWDAGGGVEVEDKREESAVLHRMNFRVDIMATGRNQKNLLAAQVIRGLYYRPNRLSLKRSGVNLDKLMSESDVVREELLPQEVYVKQMTFRTFYRSSGTLGV